LKPRGWFVLVNRFKELLDGASEDLAIRIAEDGCILVEGGLHIGPSARLRAIGIMLDRLGNRVVLVQVGGCVHGFSLLHQIGEAWVTNAYRAVQVEY
jgi:hypothetical protein